MSKKNKKSFNKWVQSYMNIRGSWDQFLRNILSDRDVIENLISKSPNQIQITLHEDYSGIGEQINLLSLLEYNIEHKGFYLDYIEVTGSDVIPDGKVPVFKIQELYKELKIKPFSINLDKDIQDKIENKLWILEYVSKDILTDIRRDYDQTSERKYYHNIQSIEYTLIRDAHIYLRRFLTTINNYIINSKLFELPKHISDRFEEITNEKNMYCNSHELEPIHVNKVKSTSKQKLYLESISCRDIDYDTDYINEFIRLHNIINNTIKECLNKSSNGFIPYNSFNKIALKNTITFINIIDTILGSSLASTLLDNKLIILEDEWIALDLLICLLRANSFGIEATRLYRVSGNVLYSQNNIFNGEIDYELKNRGFKLVGKHAYSTLYNFELLLSAHFKDMSTNIIQDYYMENLLKISLVIGNNNYEEPIKLYQIIDKYGVYNLEEMLSSILNYTNGPIMLENDIRLQVHSIIDYLHDIFREDVSRDEFNEHIRLSKFIENQNMYEYAAKYYKKYHNLKFMKNIEKLCENEERSIFGKSELKYIYKQLEVKQLKKKLCK